MTTYTLNSIQTDFNNLVSDKNSALVTGTTTAANTHITAASTDATQLSGYTTNLYNAQVSLNDYYTKTVNPNVTYLETENQRARLLKRNDVLRAQSYNLIIMYVVVSLVVAGIIMVLPLGSPIGEMLVLLVLSIGAILSLNKYWFILSRDNMDFTKINQSRLANVNTITESKMKT